MQTINLDHLKYNAYLCADKNKLIVETARLKQIFDSFNSKKILVIGDVMIDSYMWGKVERISPEAPIPVVSVTHKENRLGGAGNVALNIQALGATPVLCSVIGKDDYEKTFYSLMENNALPIHGILSSPERKTTIKTRVISDGQHLLRVDEEITNPLCKETETLFIQKISEILAAEKIDAVIFEDYDKGIITPAVIETIIALANSNNIITSVDPKKRNFGRYANITLFKPNFKEFAEGLKLDIEKGNYESINKAAALLQEKNNISYVLITLSEQGVFIRDKKEYFHIPAHVRDIADVSGAGDTVISVATLCLTAGLSPSETAIISNTAGGQVCEKVGVVLIDKNQLYKELAEDRKNKG
ncbi:MAG: D-glycero-beta-D-manno-heptose-7-phosphate kinase [Bacteroidia bacterium]|nr:D-glycero-beta-D-manno-heptose-7-phosphate kinase [Bacteroidia bacterium]